MQQILASYLLNAAWQVPVVALCALIVARFGGLVPGARNRLWLGSLAAAAILPAVSLGDLLPHALPTVARVPVGAPLGAPVALPPVSPAGIAAAEPAIRLAPGAAWIMTALFALVAVTLAVRLVVASNAARRLVRQSRPAVLPAGLTQSLEALARAHGRTAPPVRHSSSVRGPAVVGAFHPVILIPDDMAAQGDDLRAALLHELAHVLRHDYAINVTCEVLTLPVCWHPALIGLKAGVRRSRELACDAFAAQAMNSQKTYAKCLVSLAQSLGAQGQGAATQPTHTALAVGLFGRSDLEDRLMHLMNPKDTEGPFLRAARLGGLAAVGASLLGSAALLHVTPVFAQAAPAAGAAAPRAVAVAPAPADADAVTAHRHGGLIYSKKGVIIEVGHNGYRHSFTASNGEPITVVNDDPKDPSAEQQRAWEADAREAEAEGAAAEAMIDSPEFKARIAKAKAQAAAAEAMVNSPEFKATIAKAQADGEAARRMVDSPEFKARIAKARADGEAARAMTQSPAFKAMIAKAQADGEAARTMVGSPEFKARIDAARAAGEAARQVTESAEFKAQMAEIRENAAELRREMAEMRTRERAQSNPTP